MDETQLGFLSLFSSKIILSDVNCVAFSSMNATASVTRSLVLARIFTSAGSSRLYSRALPVAASEHTVTSPLNVLRPKRVRSRGWIQAHKDGRAGEGGAPACSGDFATCGRRGSVLVSLVRRGARTDAAGGWTPWMSPGAAAAAVFEQRLSEERTE